MTAVRTAAPAAERPQRKHHCPRGQPIPHGGGHHYDDRFFAWFNNELPSTPLDMSIRGTPAQAHKCKMPKPVDSVRPRVVGRHA